MAGSDLRLDQELVTLEDARSHLRLNVVPSVTDEDEDLRLKLFHATAVVLDYRVRRTPTGRRNWRAGPRRRYLI